MPGCRRNVEADLKKDGSRLSQNESRQGKGCTHWTPHGRSPLHYMNVLCTFREYCIQQKVEVCFNFVGSYLSMFGISMDHVGIMFQAEMEHV